MHRIVSLIASSTEIIYALGFGKEMVGRSHECDYPPEIHALPVCTHPKFSVDGSSYQIDQRVRAILQDAVSVYSVDADLLETLKPSHIVTQTQCEVCAVSLKDVEAAACELISSNPQIVSLEPNSLDDVWQDIRRVGTALGAIETAERLINSLKARIRNIADKAKSLPAVTVACIEWIEPLMAAGNWVPELVEMAGGINLFGEAKRHAPRMTWQELCAKDPDVIIVMPCGFDIPRTLTEMNLLAQKPEYDNLSAVKNKRVIVADGNQYFNRPGPRLVESLEIMAEVFHSQTFNFGHFGSGWVRFIND
jgi:iron complex transport system substrate-binding protein